MQLRSGFFCVNDFKWPLRICFSDAIFRCGPSRENAIPGRPQSARNRSNKNNISAEYGYSEAEAISNRFVRFALFHLHGAEIPP